MRFDVRRACIIAELPTQPLTMEAPVSPIEPSAALMRSIIQRIATGPELSKDISRDEAHAGMRLILDGKADPVQAGIFLIALRMKRETDDEHLGVFDALRESSTITTAPVDEVIDISDPYDGYVRTLPAAPFVPPLLAACGVAAVSHGVERMGPKFGVTHRQILRAAGAPVDLTPAAAAVRLGDPAIGWAYIDQAAFNPKLHDLAHLRSLIVKRPVITTLETGIGPIRGRAKTHLVTGYVHKPYPRIYALLARHAQFASALIVRGVEGGVVPSMRQTARFHYYRDDGELQYAEFAPADFGFEQALTPAALTAEDTELPHALDNDAAAQTAADAGLDALAGKPSPLRDGLIGAAAGCLWHLGRHASVAAAAAAVRRVLDRGDARRRID